MNILKTAKVSASTIAVIAGVMSYGHQTTLLLRANGGLYSYAVPFTVDVLAFISAMVRNSDVADDTSRRAASATLLLAGSMSIAANVAVGENVIQRIVGFWTVAAYLLAEWFVSRLKAKPEPVVEPEPEAEAAIDAEEQARRSERARRGAATREANRQAALAAAAAASRPVRASRRPAAPVALADIEAAYRLDAREPIAA
jgi:hypothetical protein